MRNSFQKLLEIHDIVQARFNECQSQVKNNGHIIRKLTSLYLSARLNHPIFNEEFRLVCIKQKKDSIELNRLRKSLKNINRHWLHLLYHKTLANDLPEDFKCYLTRNKIAIEYIEKL